MSDKKELNSYPQWRPIILTDRTTNRSVHITIFDREMYLSGFFNFEDLWKIYGLDGHSVKIQTKSLDDEEV